MGKEFFSGEDAKEKSIKGFVDRKEASMKEFSIKRDAAMFTTESAGENPTREKLQDDYFYWIEFFTKQYNAT